MKPIGLRAKLWWRCNPLLLRFSVSVVRQFRSILLLPPMLLGLASCKKSTQVNQAESTPVAAQSSPPSLVPIANVELPPHIKPSFGEATLFADFEHPESGGIPLYFINGKQSDQYAPRHGGDFDIKLEFQDESGKWVRAEPHYYSPCGNGYAGSIVPPGMYREINGYRPREGKTVKVRYKMYSALGIVSNEGMGVVSKADGGEVSSFSI
ncbi:MAG: hypothetical protein CFE26_10260 [Verrucomicrobiales bacterium VVV1]|nr:MAG: hypothetical protein CFE26_10260 [Verrucomicrobiales bacterium VVV1]